MAYRRWPGLVVPLGLAMLLLTPPPGAAAEPQPAPKIDVQGGQDQVPPASLDDTSKATSDVKGTEETPKEYVDPLKNKTDLKGGDEQPKSYVPQGQSSSGGNPHPNSTKGDPNNGRFPVFRSSPSPQPTQPAPKPAPRATPQPGFSWPDVSAPPLSQAPRSRPAPAGSTWRGPRYTNAYGSSNSPPGGPSYGAGTPLSGPDGQRFNSVSPGYGPSTAGVAPSYNPPASLPSYTEGSGKPGFIQRFGYDDNAPKGGYPPVQPVKGVLMRLGIDPNTYQSDDAPANLLDQIREGS